AGRILRIWDQTMSGPGVTEGSYGAEFTGEQLIISQDVDGHGTHVAGTVAQSTNNGYGVAGVAYEAKLMPLKVLSAGGGGTIS
ncbi:MAG TPA: hypothetical protein DCL61_06020, partial [Cyanobacteria bacterium UBA12227]|nr:hypothetical protein [Cyanobacteria bacterium UBA12227]